MARLRSEVVQAVVGRHERGWRSPLGASGGRRTIDMSGPGETEGAAPRGGLFTMLLELREVNGVVLGDLGGGARVRRLAARFVVGHPYPVSLLRGQAACFVLGGQHSGTLVGGLPRCFAGDDVPPAPRVGGFAPRLVLGGLRGHGPAEPVVPVGYHDRACGPAAQAPEDSYHRGSV